MKDLTPTKANRSVLRVTQAHLRQVDLVKKRAALRLAIALVLGTAILFVAAGNVAAQKDDADKAVVAVLSDDGKTVTIRKKILKKTFADGGEIRGFRVSRKGDSYQLIRYGKDAEGQQLSNGIPLEQRERSLVPRVPDLDEVKWIITCHAGACSGFCTPNETQCDCLGNSVLNEDDDYVWEVQENGDDGDVWEVRDFTGRGAGDCTFGTTGGGLFDVVQF